VSALDLRLLDADAEELLAYVQVKAARRAGEAPELTLEERIERALENLTRSGLTPDEEAPRPLTEDDDPRSIAIEGWRGGAVLTGKIAGGVVSVRLGFVDRGNTRFTFTLLNPPLQDNPLVALRGLRVFEIARATLEDST
jgi:hypothetical protein